MTVTALTKPRAGEESDTYPAVVRSDEWRVIECRANLQWILQLRAGKRHGRTRWRNRSYCRSRKGLIRFLREYTGEPDAVELATLEALPDWRGGHVILGHTGSVWTPIHHDVASPKTLCLAAGFLPTNR